MALKYLRSALEKISNSYQQTTKLEEGGEVELLTNIAQCYFNLRLYEDAIELSDQALEVEENHKMASYYKAKSLA